MYIYADPNEPFLGRLLRMVAVLALVCVSPLSNAQVSIYQEDGKLIRAPRALGVLGSELFGDKVNFYSGSLEFVQNDVALPRKLSAACIDGTAASDGGRTTGENAFWRLGYGNPGVCTVYLPLQKVGSAKAHGSCAAASPATQAQ